MFKSKMVFHKLTHNGDVLAFIDESYRKKGKSPHGLGSMNVHFGIQLPDQSHQQGRFFHCIKESVRKSVFPFLANYFRSPNNSDPIRHTSRNLSSRRVSYLPTRPTTTFTCRWTRCPLNPSKQRILWLK